MKLGDHCANAVYVALGQVDVADEFAEVAAIDTHPGMMRLAPRFEVD